MDHFAFLKLCELNEIDDNKIIYYGDMTPNNNVNEEDEIISTSSLSDSLHIHTKKDDINTAKEMLDLQTNCIETIAFAWEREYKVYPSGYSKILLIIMYFFPQNFV